ncbi:MAG: Flp family type IVb pilin [Anaerosomatales bacterium]|nr:Flp family type IVb pilin [Anaerosomatales bacterium]MDT8434296.1 Flp family type IVb pilin [Anaerosomatales bacterium]
MLGAAHDIGFSTPHEDEGATAVEYAVLVVFIALVIVVGVGMFGSALNGFFESFLPELPFG